MKRIAIYPLLLLFALCGCKGKTGTSQAGNVFKPGEIWPDNNGVHINAHGGGMLQQGDTYYWFGEHKTEGEGGNVAQVGVHCYSSKDLYNWKDEGIALSVSDDESSPIVKGCILERPKVIFNKNVVGLAQSSIWIYSIPLKHIVTAAHYNGKIPRNPFAMYHVDPDHKEREFLTLDELTAMTDIKLEDPNMAFARDLFIFGCWTGISFIDIKNLTEDNISMVNSAPWIVSKRQKTGVPFQIKLMDIPMQIVERYKSFRKGNHLFNIGNLDGINKRIKKVAVMCGIKKRVSFHVSRHSWAVLALEYGMPIESVSKILGHTNITTTQIYAKVTSTKLDHDIAVFESRIKGHLPVMGGIA